MRRVRLVAIGLIGGTAWLYAVGLTPVDTYLAITVIGVLALIGSLVVDAITRAGR